MQKNARLVYKSSIAYPSFRKRLYAHTPWRLLLWVLGAQIVGLVVAALVFSDPFLLFLALFLSLGFLLNYMLLTPWVRYFISRIVADKEKDLLEIHYFDKDKPQNLQLALRRADFKIERLRARGRPLYKFCIYEGQKLLFYQKCDIGYWTKQHCEALIKDLS